MKFLRIAAMEKAKHGVWAVWVGSLAAMLFGTGWVANAGHLAFWLTLFAHIGEFFANRSLFERAGGSMGHHFVQTLIYGLFHWVPIRQRLTDPPE